MSSIEVANVEASKEQPLNLMVSFIEQEALEKMEEIETRANEEFVIEKGRLVEQNMEKIDTYYERKLKQVDIQQKIQASNAFNQARLECLRAREQHLEDVLLEAEKNLETISSDDGRYPEATIVCRQKDVDLVKGLVGECLDEVEKASGVRTAITIEQNIFLSPESAGGVEASSQGGKIKVSSTLESRLRLIADQIVPQVRTALFGSNPNRRFFD
ncbi:hypothetical protein QR680_005475 [Steinernema hermaphroditum]|uniref:V-type proton ATPase subunit E n=1 Tax=Steinernema hermaphroditum TaxID=289476 RepID=A0AA39LUY2_9BILA|nr:hypothetical protein QR680_005475 [Steinernema hermaphroditum]